MLDVWQADTDGAYEAQLDVDEARLRGEVHLRGRRHLLRADDRAARATAIPMDGPVGDLIGRTDISHFRPAHVHFLLNVPGYEPLITHLFQEGAEYLDSDVVFGTKAELVVGFERARAGPDPGRRHVGGAVAAGGLRLRAAGEGLTLASGCGTGRHPVIARWVTCAAAVQLMSPKRRSPRRPGP